MHERAGDLRAAAEMWERLHDMLPNHWWPLYALVEAHEQQEDLASTIAVWETLVASPSFEDPCVDWWEHRLDRTYM